MALPHRLYHYTNAPGLLGILASRRIWATDIEFLNDAEELTFARGPVANDVAQRIKNLDVPDEGSVDDPLVSRAAILSTVLNALTGGSGPDFSDYHRAFASCFCEKGDLLSQWRAYGTDGGYAIGFDPDALRQIAGPEEPARLEKVKYGLDEARAELDAAVTALAQQPSAHPGVQGDHQYRSILLPVLAMIKHPAFAEELEWRLLAIGSVAAQYILFRPGEVGVIPYLQLSLPEGAVVEVVVGPGGSPDVRANGVRQLLQQHRLDARVIASSTPLRL